MHGNDFIETYDDAIDAATCAALIRRFDASSQAHRGRTGGGVDTAVKDSWDITVSELPAWADATQVLNRAMLAGLSTICANIPIPCSARCG